MPTQIATSFSLTGNFNPDELSRTLGLQPTRTWRAGDSVGKRSIDRADDGGAIEVPRVDSLDVADQIAKLLTILEARLSDLFIVTAKYKLVSIVACAVYVEAADGTPPAMHFPPETIARLNEMGTSLDIDLYVLT